MFNSKALKMLVVVIVGMVLGCGLYWVSTGLGAMLSTQQVTIVLKKATPTPVPTQQPQLQPGQQVALQLLAARYAQACKYAVNNQSKETKNFAIGCIAVAGSVFAGKTISTLFDFGAQPVPQCRTAQVDFNLDITFFQVYLGEVKGPDGKTCGPIGYRVLYISLWIFGDSYKFYANTNGTIAFAKNASSFY